MKTNQTYELRTMLEKIGAIDKSKEHLFRRAHERLDQIEEIANKYGRGEKLGIANNRYSDLMQMASPILDQEQLEALREKYDRIKNIWMDN